MKLFGWSCYLFGLAALPLFGAEAVTTADPMAEACAVLQSDYVDFSRMQVRPGDRLNDLAARSGGGISLDAAATEKAVVPPILTALLPDNILYCRIASFQPGASWSDFAARFDKWIGQGAQGVVLDIRSNVAPDDFDGAAHLAGLFLPSGTFLFGIRDARGNARPYASVAPDSAATAAARPPVTVPLMILTDARTNGAAETFAAVMQAHGALVMGHATAGRGGLFAGKLLASGQVLRYLRGEVVMPDGTLLWNHPIIPDIGVAPDPKKEQAALALISQEHIADVIGEATERHRMSEAALVQGEDPEIDASPVSGDSSAATIPPVVAAQDAVLVEALDSLKAIRISQWAPAAPPGTPAGLENTPVSR